MDCMNNCDNPLYKIGIMRTQDIHQKLKKSKLSCFNNNLKVVGTKSEILSHLKGGSTKNLINQFFKYKTNKCDYCGIEKSRTTQLDRAHCNKDGFDRIGLLQKSINEHFINENTPIKISLILMTFIKYHENIPLFILCKNCHRNYDS